MYKAPSLLPVPTLSRAISLIEINEDGEAKTAPESLLQSNEEMDPKVMMPTGGISITEQMDATEDGEAKLDHDITIHEEDIQEEDGLEICYEASDDVTQGLSLIHI